MMQDRGVESAYRFASRACILAFLLCGGPARLLRAHATLLHSSPSPAVRLASAPDKLELVFNERIESVFHSLQVVDAQGNLAESGEARVDAGGESLTVPLSGLAPGAYAVYWRINSLDGHQVAGQFGFGVSADPPSEAQLIAWRPVAGQGIPPWFFPLLKGLSLLAMACWLGGYGLAAFGGDGAALGTGARGLHEQFLGKAWNISRAAGAAFVVVELFSLLGKAAAFTGGGIAGSLNTQVLAAALTGSSYGEWWTIRIAAAALLLFASLFNSREQMQTTPMRLFTALASLTIIASIAVTGHAQAAAGQRLLAEGMHAVHLAASVLWAGGLFHLGIGVGQAAAESPADEAAIEWLSRIAPRFSRLAQVSMALIVLTGIYNTWLHVPGWPAFLSTGYGRALLGKLLWVGFTLGVAFINWRKVLPELARLRQGAVDSLKWLARFQPLLQAEFAGCLIIFATVGMLTNMPPAAADPGAGVRELRKTSGAYEVVLRIEPARLGVNQVQVQVLDAAGQPLRDVRKVMVYLRSLDMDMGLTTAETPALPEAAYGADVVFSMSGRWRVSVEITPAQGDAFVVEYDVIVG